MGIEEVKVESVEVGATVRARGPTRNYASDKIASLASTLAYVV